MLNSIYSYFSENGLPIAMAVLLLLVIFNKGAYEKLQKKFAKISITIGIVCYFFQFFMGMIYMILRSK